MYAFVNLKRFDVPRRMGGICPDDDPVAWITRVIRRSVELGLGSQGDGPLVYLVPEGLLPAAAAELGRGTRGGESRIGGGGAPPEHLSVGCQGVFRDDVTPGGNFGAFTTNLPAAAASALGARWTIIGHSEERRDKLGLLEEYDDAPESLAARRDAVSRVVNREARRALERGLDVLLCMGESEAERGGGTFEEQKPRIREALRSQVELGLEGVSGLLSGRQLVIGYEPIWAIGPGKTPPDAPYIDFVASFIKRTAAELYDLEVPVVYGGGLKETNAAEIGSVKSVDGGLVALTQFTAPIGFDVDSLVKIIALYRNARESA